MNQKNDLAIPRYQLKVTNNRIQKNIITFDIYLRHTDDIEFEYAGGQYFLEFNPEIANGGELKYSIVDSDLSSNMKPRNASIGDDPKDSSIKILRLAVNTFPGAGAGFYISKDEPGTRIVKMRLSTSADEFANENLSLKWRKPPTTVVFGSRIFAYVNNVNTDISDQVVYTIEQPSLMLSHS